jgi:hypothetical protein
MEMAEQQLPIEQEDLRTRAVARLNKRRDFGTHLFVYLVFNACLVGIWAFTGASVFWPAIPMGLWGIGLVLHAWDVYWRKPVSEEDIRREIERMR